LPAQLNIALGIMKIRSATMADARSLAELIASFQPMLTLDPSGVGAEQYLASVSEAAERHYLVSPRYTYFVTEHKGEVVGFIAMRDRTHLFHLFVASEYQRQGIAGSLWREAREHAVRPGEPSVFTVNSSLNAVVVYERFGFMPSGAEVQAHGIAFLPMRLAVKNGA
jgi:ribosomal protein S18 acetylase RimI-like enzyme